MAHEKDNEPVGPDSFGGEDYPSGELFPLSPNDPDWAPPPLTTPMVPIDPIEASFLRVEAGLQAVMQDRDRLERNLDVVLKDMRSLRTSIEDRFKNIERRISNVETDVATMRQSNSVRPG